MNDKINDNELNGVSGGTGKFVPELFGGIQCTVFQCRFCHTTNGHADDCAFHNNGISCDICDGPARPDCPQKLRSAGEL